MVRITRLYLDTNILIALAEGEDDVSDALKQLVSRSGAPVLVLFTSELTLAELIVRPYREQNDELLNLYESWLSSDGPFQTIKVNRSNLRVAASIRAQHPAIKLPDAIHLSTAITEGCSHVLTADGGIPDRLDVKVRTEDGATSAKMVTTLRPSLATINSINGSQAEA